MNTAEFNRLLRIARNGGREVIGEEASKLNDLLRRMVGGFLRRKQHRADSATMDDLVSALFVKLLQIKRIPKGYTWNSWFWFAIKNVWMRHCDMMKGPEHVSIDASPNDMWRAGNLPVPVQANARMLEDGLVDLLRRRAAKHAPRVDAERDVWNWAVDMLLTHGVIQNARNAAVRSGLDEEICRQIVLRAVVLIRLAFEDLYGRSEYYTVEECDEARSLAARIF